MARKYREDTAAYHREYYQKNKTKVQAATNRYKKKNPLKVKAWRLKMDYGLSLEEYAALGNCCNICGSTDRICVDHCHTTLKVRGLLCRKCNLALGHFKDDLNLIIKAQSYLEGSVIS